jgi:hypothetical protein
MGFAICASAVPAATESSTAKTILAMVPPL